MVKGVVVAIVHFPQDTAAFLSRACGGPQRSDATRALAARPSTASSRSFTGGRGLRPQPCLDRLGDSGDQSHRCGPPKNIDPSWPGDEHDRLGNRSKRAGTAWHPSLDYGQHTRRCDAASAPGRRNTISGLAQPRIARPIFEPAVAVSDGCASRHRLDVFLAVLPGPCSSSAACRARWIRLPVVAR